MRFFNTTGPVVPADHYCIPPLSRLHRDEVLGLVRDKRYFVPHAPRQIGKTSALLALQELLNSSAEGGFRCVYANLEAGQAMRRETHLDQLADKLQEDRVRRVVEPLLSGSGENESSARDIEYVRDLGLIAQHGPLRIANPIYAEAVET